MKTRLGSFARPIFDAREKAVYTTVPNRPARNITSYPKSENYAISHGSENIHPDNRVAFILIIYLLF